MKTDALDWPEKSRELSQLLARTGLGDRRAFAALYDRTSAHLFGVILRIQRDRALAEDLLQEIYVSVWKAAASFDAARSQPLTWLTSIARNRAIDSLAVRRRSRSSRARRATMTTSGRMRWRPRPTKGRARSTCSAAPATRAASTSAWSTCRRRSARVSPSPSSTACRMPKWRSSCASRSAP
jgi:RNA polymerase sigma factor (sigma-70 family)